MTIEDQLAEAAAAQALRRSGLYGRTFRDGPDDPEVEPPESALDALPTVVHIVYEDASGDITERAVTLISAWRDDGGLQFKARCHLRQALRTFRADRVVELVCLATGEVPADPATWLAEHALFDGDREADYTPHALRSCRDELALMAFVGAADGVLDPDEVEVAIDYVMMSTEREIDRHRTAVYIRRLEPSIADLPAHLGALSRHPEKWPRLMRAMRRLIDSDRVVSVEEQVAWAEISTRYDQALERRERDAAAAQHRELAGLIADSLMAKGDFEASAFQNMIASAFKRQP